jgi:lysophospholipase
MENNHHLSSSAPESQVLIIMTGGTICMQRSPAGFVPARGFQETCLAKIPSFNDGSAGPQIPMKVVVDASGETKSYASLRTPPSLYERQVRYTVLEFEELLDSSSIDSNGWAEIAQTIYNNYTLFDAFVVLVSSLFINKILLSTDYYSTGLIAWLIRARR